MGVEIRIDLGGLIAQRAEVFDYSGVLGLEHGHHLVPDPNPLEVSLMIRGVVDEWKFPVHRVGPHIGPTAIEERANDPVGPSSLDPSETAEAGATKKACQDGFRLIILGVTDRDANGMMGVGDLLERLIAKLTRSGLNRCALSRHLHARRIERNAQRARKGTHLLDLRCGLGPEPMIDRCRANGDAELAPQPMQHVQQGDRIRAAGARDQHVISRRHQRAFADRPPHRRKDHERTLEHARREGKPHLGSVAEATHSRCFGVPLGSVGERHTGHRHAKTGT